MTKDEREAIKSALKWWGGIAATASQPPNGWPRESIFSRIIRDNFKQSEVMDGLKEQIDWDAFQKIDLAVLKLKPKYQQAIRFRYIYRFPFWWAKSEKTTYYNRVCRAESLLKDLMRVGVEN